MLVFVVVYEYDFLFVCVVELLVLCGVGDCDV